MAAPAYIGAIDQGTTSSRFILFDRAGNIITSAQKGFTQHTPQPGWTEHDAEEIWEGVVWCIRNALAGSNPKNSLGRDIHPDEIAGVGITNQRETTLVWNRHTGTPYARALVWMDTRTADICEELSRGSELGKDRFRRRTGLPISPYFSGTKLTWLLRNVDGLQAAALAGDAVCGTVDTWLLWKLSGSSCHCTDPTNASRTMLMDLKRLAWDEDLCAAFGVPLGMLPEIRTSSEVYCSGTADGPLPGVKISGILGDQQAALFGQAGMDTGSVKCTYGTGCFMLCNVGTTIVQSQHQLLTTVAYQLPGQEPRYALEGSVPFAGACIDWLADNLGLIASARESTEVADPESNGGVYFVPALSGLYAPHWRDDARGCIVGLTRFANKRHVVRAGLEAVCFQTQEVYHAMCVDAKSAELDLSGAALRVDGGMSVNNTFMQMQANILGLGVLRPRIIETTALGAAYVAGLAVGFWESVEEIKTQWSLDRRFDPDTQRYSEEQRAREYDMWQRAVRRSLNWTLPSGEAELERVRKELGVCKPSGFTSAQMIAAAVGAAGAAAAAVYLLVGRRRS